MPKKAQKGPKWPELGPNTFYFCISSLKMSQLNVKRDTDYQENISKKSKILNMRKKVQNGQHLIFLSFRVLGNQYHFLHKVETFSVQKYKNERCLGLILAILGHFGPFWAKNSTKRPKNGKKSKI